jgi:flagellar biosynthesis protein FliQ
MFALLVDSARIALMLSIAVALPVLLVAALVGLLVSAFQAATQLQDVTIAHLPRLLAVTGALVFLGPRIGHEIATFARTAFMQAALTIP